MKVPKDVPYAAALCLFVGAVFCAFYGRNGVVDWQTPVRYQGDTVPFLAQMKAARDGWVVPVAATFVPDLNAPFEANWNDYPQTQKTFFWLAGRASLLLGLAATANLLLLAAHLLAGLSFFGVARYLRSDRRWAFVGAALFACSPYIWRRGLEHLSLSLYWHVPLALLVSGWCFRRCGLPLRSRRFALAAALAGLAALLNVYYAAMFIQLLVLAAAAHACRGNVRRAVAPLLLVGLTLGVFVVESLGTMLYPRRHGANPAAVGRPYAELETYALRPIELLLPPNKSLLYAGRLGGAYWERPRGEGGAAYIGIAALCGLGLLLTPLLGALVARRRVWVSPAVAAAAWILAFSVVGGTNALLGVVGVALLRGTNRYCIWLAAIALLYLTGRLSRLAFTRRHAAVLAGVVLAVALADQTPLVPANAERHRERFENDRRFAARLESAVPYGGMLFMLPVVDYPEVGLTHRLPDYTHFRSYLFTSHLRYSYGGNKGRPREAWQRAAEALPPAAMIDRLERYGFAGIVLERRGYEDGGEAVLQGLAAAGRSVAIDDADEARVFVPLQPRGSERP